MKSTTLVDLLVLGLLAFWSEFLGRKKLSTDKHNEKKVDGWPEQILSASITKFTIQSSWVQSKDHK